MCCVNSPETVKKFLKDNKDKDEFTFYKVYRRTPQNNLWPTFFPDKMVQPGVIKSNNRKTIKESQEKCGVIFEGIHVYLYKKFALIISKIKPSYVVVPVLCRKKDLLGIEFPFHGSETAVFTKVRLRKRAYKKAIS